MMTSSIKFILRSSLLSLLIVGTMLPAYAFEYGGIGGRPANPDPENARTESIFVYTLSPGTVKEDGVNVINNTDEARVLQVYASDSTPSSDGGFACKQFSETSTDVGSWIQLSESEVSLEPHGSVIVPFTITVPAQVDVGEHNGCILIQAKPQERNQQSSGINLSLRTGLRVAITIPGTIIRKLDMSEVQLLQKGTKKYIHPIVLNSGNVSLDTEVHTVTKGVLGGVFHEQTITSPVLGNQNGEWNIELPNPFWGGWYQTMVTISYDDGTKSGNKSVLTSTTEWFFMYPTPAGFVTETILLLVCIALIFWFWYFYAHKKWVRTEWKPYTVQAGDTIKSLGTQFAVSWKVLAHVNRLKAPYDLLPGQVIQVPPVS